MGEGICPPVNHLTHSLHIGPPPHRCEVDYKSNEDYLPSFGARWLSKTGCKARHTVCDDKMKASPLLISWHNDNTPIYSAHFEPHGKGRLATAGGDNNVRIWKVEREGEERTVTYLTTLIKVALIHLVLRSRTDRLVAHPSSECCSIRPTRYVAILMLSSALTDGCSGNASQCRRRRQYASLDPFRDPLPCPSIR